MGAETRTDARSGSSPLSIRKPTRRELLLAGLVLNTELLFFAVYLLLTDARLGSIRFPLYGLLWVNVSLLVFYSVRPASTDRRTKRIAAAVAVGYFALLAFTGGLVTPGIGEAATGFRIAWLPPGWGPAPLYSGHYVNVTLMPSYVIGFLALAYLVYVAAIDAAGAAAAGILGLFSCVSCSWPIIAAVGSSVLGGGGVLATSALQLSYDLSTVVFLLTVAMLWWRPIGR